MFLLTTAVSKPALGPTQPPIQCVTGSLSQRVKGPRSEADLSPPSSAKIKTAWSCTSTPPIRLHGAVFGKEKAQGQRYLYLSTS
jgi:hypothetical protein